jgi:hypothetical protein
MDKEAAEKAKKAKEAAASYKCKCKPLRTENKKLQSRVNELKRKLRTIATALDDMAVKEELIVKAASKHVKTMNTCKECAQIICILMDQVKNAERTMSVHKRMLEAVMAQEVDIMRAAEERDAFIESISKQRAMCIKMAAFISEKPASSSKENEASEEEEASEDEESSVEEEASKDKIIDKKLAVEHGLVGVSQKEGVEMISFLIDHGKESELVPPNSQLADDINRIAKGLLRSKKINQYLNNAGATVCIVTSNRAWRSTWFCPTNNHAVNKATDVKGAEDMALSQFLRVCFQSDAEGKKRLCYTGLHMGLFITSHLIKENIAPSVANLIPGTKQTEDFDEESGSVDIGPVIEISKQILSHDLKNRRGIFMERKAGLDALIDVIRNEGHSVKTLTEPDLNMIIG